jgi:hypothetical protein
MRFPYQYVPKERCERIPSVMKGLISHDQNRAMSPGETH